MTRYTKTALTLLAMGLSLVGTASAQQNQERFNQEGFTDVRAGGVIAMARTMIDAESAGAPGQGQEAAAEPGGEGAQAVEAVQDNGTNPTSIGFKFMPYFRFTELDNGVTSTDNLTLFAMLPIPLSPFTAINLEWPLQKTFDASALVTDFLDGALDPEDGIPCAPPVCSGNRPISDIPTEVLASGFDQNGVGDLKLWFIQGLKAFGTPGEGMTTALIGGFQLNAPTATHPVLGEEKWLISPLFAHVHNFSAQSFMAFMHIYTLDIGDKSGISDLHRDSNVDYYMGRYFYQYAWPKSGYYLLPEVQVMYDDNSGNDWSIHFMPEIGKSFKAGSTGVTAYIKPGWALDSPDPGERKFSVELGIRLIP